MSVPQKQLSLPVRVIQNVWIWIMCGLAFAILFKFASTEVQSPFVNWEFALFAVMAGGLLLQHRLPFAVSRRVAPYLYVLAVLLLGAVYEATLTVDGNGIGGMHQETDASYILAFGDYAMIAVTSVLVVHFTRAGFKEMFFFAGGKSLTEGLIFTGALTVNFFSPFAWATPFVLAYYTLAYASFVALPLLFIDPAALWKQGAKPRGIVWYWLAGFALAMITRIVWGVGYAPLVEWVFGLPPNAQP